MGLIFFFLCLGQVPFLFYVSLLSSDAPCTIVLGITFIYGRLPLCFCYDMALETRL